MKTKQQSETFDHDATESKLDLCRESVIKLRNTIAVRDDHIRRQAVMFAEHKRCAELDAHDKIGDIIRLDHDNKKLTYEIEIAEGVIVEKDRIFGELLSCIDEYLQDKAHLADRIECLEGELTKYEPLDDPTPVSNMGEDDGSLFEFVKKLIVDLSNAEEQPIDPNDIDMMYLKHVIAYTMPGLFSMYALLGEDEKHRFELAGDILHKFRIETMAKYEELVNRGDVDILIIDRRV